ncbi:MAG: nucleotidyltransferase family protein [Myxococcaceae bacterium]|nr:nucleotidyltransferase family protein [Myxococcaceae bacterium]
MTATGGERVGALVLAAGASTRFGSPKQVTPWKGQPLVRFVAGEVAAVVPRVVVVTGAHAALVREALEGTAVQLVFAEHWARGPGASVKAGLCALGDVDAVLITLCDLPHVTRDDYGRLVGARGGLVAAAFDGAVGAPVVVRAPYLEDLAGLDDASGASQLLRSHRAQVVSVPCPAAALDLDVPVV